MAGEPATDPQSATGVADWGLGMRGKRWGRPPGFAEGECL